MDFGDLLAFKKAFENGMAIFQISKTFPSEEKYSLTDQIRRSSRSVNANIAEAYRKRRFVKHFISKLTDADGENSETSVWLLYCKECGYMEERIYDELNARCLEIGKLINYMINNPEKFGSTDNT